MPSKVRCTSCKSVLNAPDAARGKAIRCPKCQSIVRVPKPKPSKATMDAELAKIIGEVKALKGYQELEEEGLFAKLDLNDAEDTSTNVCPKCGEELFENDTVCPGCGLDLEAHAAGQDQPVKKTRSQRDAELYYRDVWRDSWTFMKEHRTLALRTTLYWVIAGVLAGVCFGLAGNFAQSNKPPLVIFFAAVGLLAGLCIPGWGWSMWIEITQGTLDRKSELKRINLDIFLTIALGLKSLLWSAANALQFSVATAVIVVPLVFSAGPTTASLVGGLLASTIGVLIIPVVMAHMAMPVQWKAWVTPIMWKVTFKVIKPVLYWWVMVIATSVASVVLGVVMMFIVFNYTLPIVNAFEQKLQLPPGLELPGANQQTSTVVAYVIIGALVLLQILLFAISAFASILLMRAHGIFTRSFKRYLALITELPQTTFVSKTAIREQREKEKEERAHQRRLAKKRKKQKKSK